MLGILTLALASLLAVACEPRPGDHRGRLKDQLVPVSSDAVLEELWLEAVSEEEWQVNLALSPGDEVFAAVWALSDGGILKILLVEPLEGDCYIFADANLNGELTRSERFQFDSIGSDDLSDGEILLRLPIPVGSYGKSPFLLRRIILDQEAREWLAENQKRFLGVSVGHAVEGFVKVGGSEMLVRFGSNEVDTRNGWMGMDGNRDGVVDTDPWSLEWAYAQDENVIFRVGKDRYLSFKDLDAAAMTVTLAEHELSEYQRIELRVGAKLPDFPFTDFDGESRSLSEFWGTYLLLDFWHTRCPPCVEAIPHLRAVHERFASRGFDILGMNHEFTDDFKEGLLRARSLTAAQELTWTHATTESIQNLALKELRISSWPTYILLDRNGEIVSYSPGPAGLPSIVGEDLVETLEALLGICSNPDACSGVSDRRY